MLALNVEFNDLDILGLPSCEREALVALYNATNGDNWTTNTHWLSAQPLGDWHGVTTDANGRVTGLLLTVNQLRGSIPAELGNLNKLTHLYLGGNRLSGSIPAALGNLNNLTHLYLRDNQLRGCVPDSLRTVANNDFGSLGLAFCQ